MSEQLDLTIAPTPNPNAFKFILDRKVKDEGRSSYKTSLECQHNPLALRLFTIRGVDQIHFFDNVITVTKFGYEDWEVVEDAVYNTLKEHLPNHDSSYEDPDPEKERRAALPQELKDIEAILDKTIRPGLQGDGGDLRCLSYTDNVLVIQYEGACGTCPSSTTGTLQAITQILKEQYNPEIEVYTSPAI